MAQQQTLALQHFDELSTYEISRYSVATFFKSGVSKPSQDAPDLSANHPCCARSSASSSRQTVVLAMAFASWLSAAMRPASPTATKHSGWQALGPSFSFNCRSLLVMSAQSCPA
jgi:hypothetical protein